MIFSRIDVVLKVMMMIPNGYFLLFSLSLSFKVFVVFSFLKSSLRLIVSLGDLILLVFTLVSVFKVTT